MAPRKLGLLVGAACLLLAAAHALLEAADDMCNFETLYTDATCILEPPGPCIIHILPEANCYEIFPMCRDNKTFNTNEDFSQESDPGGNRTNLKIWNRKENQLLVLTMIPDEIWWRLDLPDGEYNITVLDLPGQLNRTNPMLLPASCEACPAPRIKLAAIPKLHKFQFMVPRSKEGHQNNKSSEMDVSIKLFGSNETIYSDDLCKRPMYATATVNGTTNEVITIGGLYSTEYCFVVEIKYASLPYPQSYICGKKVNMTDVPYEPYEAQIEIPTWWIAVLLLVIVALALGSLVPIAVHKGLLRFPRSDRNGTGRVSDAEGQSPPRPEKRPFLQMNGDLLPSKTVVASAVLTNSLNDMD